MKAYALLAALFLGALALRPQLVGVGPLLPEIDDDLGISHAVAGLLGTIPVLCMGLFAPPAAYLAGRLGTRAAIATCLAGIAGFGLLRAAAPGAPLVLTLTFPIGVGMGLAGALIPVAVKERFAHRPAFASGVYTTGITGGAALSSGLAVPIAGALGGWRASLAVFSGVTILLFLAWIALTPAARERPPSSPPRLPWGRRVVWVLVAVFALQSIVYYGLVSWMPDSFQERGWSAEAAGSLVGVMSIAGLPSGLLLPFFADRLGSRRQWLGLTAGALFLATVGIATLPDAGWAWAALAGLGIGATFPLTLTLPLDVARDPADTGAVVGLMLGAGYTIAAAGPFLL
ncbi:MAG: MFS transporter, partial [Actinomycetota bacterium]|nr:MFS transporter [Actinomycetota bacterium]